MANSRWQKILLSSISGDKTSCGIFFLWWVVATRDDEDAMMIWWQDCDDMVMMWSHYDDIMISISRGKHLFCAYDTELSWAQAKGHLYQYLILNFQPSDSQKSHHSLKWVNISFISHLIIHLTEIKLNLLYSSCLMN